MNLIPIKTILKSLFKQRTSELKKQSGELQKQNDILQLERNELRTIIDNIPDLIYIKDRESRFLNANQRQIIHLNRKRLKEVVGKTDFDFYPEEYANNYFSDERKIIVTGKPIINKKN
jgi:PAS domain-containing protein